MRGCDGNTSMAIDARVATSAEAPGAIGADFDKWGGTLTNCVGGHILYAPFAVPVAAAGPIPSKLTLDDSIDWRDRLLVVRARLKHTDIRPGTADSLTNLIQQPNNTANLFVLDTEFYTGGGWSGDVAHPRGGANSYTWTEFLTVQTDTMFVDWRLYADQTDGNKLKLWNNNLLNPMFGTIWIFASEQTGKIVAVP